MYTHEQIWDGIDHLASSFGYSTSGLAKKAGLDPTAFNKSKRISPDGKPRWPSTESLSKVLAVTGSNLNDFFDFIHMDDEASAAASDKPIADQAAEILLRTESVLMNAEQPFTLTSGRKSPVYVDCRKPIGFAVERAQLMQMADQLLRQEIGTENYDYLAGGETAGIPYAAYLSGVQDKPMVYVRKQPKGFGRMAQIEGYMPSHSARAVLVEDLQTDGGSKRVFIDALRKAGASVEHAFVVFHYGIFPQSRTNMADMGVQLHSLCNWWDVLRVARAGEYFDDKTLVTVEAFLNDPEGWES